jgi:hypothetical protein
MRREKLLNTQKSMESEILITPVKPGQVKKVKQSILESVSLSEIQAFLTQKI